MTKPKHSTSRRKRVESDKPTPNEVSVMALYESARAIAARLHIEASSGTITEVAGDPERCLKLLTAAHVTQAAEFYKEALENLGADGAIESGAMDGPLAAMSVYYTSVRRLAESSEEETKEKR